MDFEVLVAAASVLVAIFTYFVTTLLDRNQKRRDATFVMLRTIIFEDGPIYQANLEFARWSSQDREFPDDKIDDPEDAKTVVELMNFFDLIADSASKKVIDKGMVIAHLGGRMSTANKMFGDYIKARRDTLERDGLYKPFQDFLKNNAPEIAQV